MRTLLLARRRMNVNPKSGHDGFDRDIYVLVVVTGLAFSLNVQGLMALVDKHLPLLSARIVAYMFVLTSGGLIGLFSKRIACRITAWRDQG
jgi:hypothetical protein